MRDILSKTGPAGGRPPGFSRRAFMAGSAATGATLAVATAAGFGTMGGLMGTARAQQRELTMLAWPGHAEPDIVAAFEQRHNVRVRAKYYTGGDNMLGLIAQSPPGTFDLILSDAEYVQQLREAGHIEALDPRDYPFDDFFPEFQKFPGHWQGDTLYAVALRFGFLGVAYNSDAISATRARSYRLFWDPTLAGKVGHLDWHLPNLGQVSLLNGNARPFDIDAAAWAAVQNRAMTLRPQIAGFFDFGGTFASLRSGQVLAMAGIGDYITGLLQRNGVAVRTAIPEEGGLQWTEGYCIGRGSRRQDLARAFIQHMTAPEGQVRSAMMEAYPAMIPSRKGWELLNARHPDEAGRQGMLLGKANAMDEIRAGRIKLRQIPSAQTLEAWNDFWVRYKSA